jgi:DNA-directed RNA polymerase specialized sigma24 family protein
VAHVRTAALLQAGDYPTDAELLELFLSRHDGAAFEALLRRHAPMVLGVCRRVLRHAQDTEDAFQATFLVLARKAASLRSRALLGHWLYGIAFRTALKARAMNL